jgi:hypothetical protein
LQHPGMLPQDLPHARVIAFGYDVKTKSKNVSVATLKDHADGLVQDLMRLRYDTKVRLRNFRRVRESLTSSTSRPNLDLLYSLPTL